MAAAGKRKSTFLTFKDKSTIIKEIEEGKSKEDIIKTYGIAKTSLYEILRKKENIIALSKNEHYKRKKTVHSSKDTTLEECLYTWFLQAQAAGEPISGSIIQEKALELNKLLEGSSNFKASNGWLEKFKNRHGIHQTTRGKFLSDDSEAAKIFQNEILKKIERKELLLENVYNADESGLYWKSFPNVTLARQEEKTAPMRKDIKGRITVLFCSNAAGTNKIKLCIIGQFAESKSIKNSKDLPVVYKSQKKGLMTQYLFKKWYQDHFIPAVLEYQQKSGISGKVLLLLDNAPSHPAIDVLNNINKNFEIKYVPQKVTSNIQPMNQGIISLTKKEYKKQFLSLFEKKQLKINEFLRNFTLKDCINLISDIWQNISPSTLRQAWKFMLRDLLSVYTYQSPETTESDDESIEKSIEVCSDTSQQLKHIAEIKEWIDIDEHDEGWGYLNDKDIVETVTNCKKEFEFVGVPTHIDDIRNESFALEFNCNCGEVSRHVHLPLKEIPISHMQAHQYLQSLKVWCEQQSECDATDILNISKLLDIAATKAMHENNLLTLNK